MPFSAILSAVGLALALVVAHVAASDQVAFDAHAYWLARGYDLAENQPDAFVYSPPILMAFRAVATVLSWPAFLQVWSVAIAIGVWALAGPLTILVLFTPAVASEITLGNIHIFLALIAVAGFRWPGLWAFALLTKVTPGVGLLWFVVRREWRSLGIALGVTAAIALPTVLAAPNLWAGWVRELVASSGATASSFGVPLSVRFATAAVMVCVGAQRTWRWTVPLASMVALPILWDVHGLSMLLGVLWVANRATLPAWPARSLKRMGTTAVAAALALRT